MQDAYHWNEIIIANELTLSQGMYHSSFLRRFPQKSTMHIEIYRMSKSSRIDNI